MKMGNNNYFGVQRGQWELLVQFIIITNSKVVLIPSDFKNGWIHLNSITFYSYMLAFLSLCCFFLSVGFDY